MWFLWWFGWVCGGAGCGFGSWGLLLGADFGIVRCVFPADFCFVWIGVIQIRWICG